MFVDDVLSDCHVDGHGNLQPVAGGQHAGLAVREPFFFDHAADGLAQSNLVAYSLRRRLVDAARFVP